MKVTEEAVQRVLSEMVVNREKRRQIQKMTTEDLKRYLVRIYRMGFEDGADACEQAARNEAEETEEVKVDWDDVLRVIGEVKGIGPKMLDAIDQKMKEAIE